MNDQADFETMLARHFDDVGGRTRVDRRFVEVIETVQDEPGLGRGRDSRSWLLAAAAGLLVVVGIGALLTLGRSSTESDASLDMPAVCAPGTETTGGDDTLPAIDQSAPGFVTALPADASTAELVVRALLNPPGGPGCLAYDPDRIDLSSSEPAGTVDASLSLADGTSLDLRVSVGRTPTVVGITDITGVTTFDISTTQAGSTLILEGLPERAATVTVDVDASTGRSTTAVAADASEPIELLDDDGLPIRLLERISFTVIDSDGDVIDAGGSAFDPILANCETGGATPCVAEVESFGSAFLTAIAFDLGRSTEIEAGSCTRSGRGDDSVTICIVPLDDGRSVLLADSPFDDLTIRAGGGDAAGIDVPFPPLPGIAVVVPTATGDYQVVGSGGDIISSISSPTEPTLEL